MSGVKAARPLSPLGALPLRFTKMSGAGNDFLVWDEAVSVGAAEIAAIQRLCRRGTGVGADGVLFVVPDGPGRVAADYRNADGSVGRFCGNGTRCAARFAVLKGLAPENLIVKTGWGDVVSRVESEPDVHFAHKSGFMCKTSASDPDRLKALLTIAWRQ